MLYSISAGTDSGKAEGELGKYLGAGISAAASGLSNFEFLAQGTAVVNLSTPQYQFVISEVNTETNEITFTNRETKEGFTCLLDTTATVGVYNVVSITKTGNADPTAVKVANLTTVGKYDFTTSINMTGKNKAPAELLPGLSQLIYKGKYRSILLFTLDRKFCPCGKILSVL